MKISIRDLKRIIKEQIEEGWSDKDDAGPRGPALDLSQGKPSQLGGWTDRDAGDFDAEGSELVTTAVTALEEAQAALSKIAQHYDYKGPRFLLFNNRIDDMIEFIETK